MFCWYEASRTKIRHVFLHMGVKGNVDQLTMLCAAPEVFGISPLDCTMRDWVVHFIAVEIAERLNTEYGGAQPVWMQHLQTCLHRYPWQTFAEKALTEDFINEYHMMLEQMDEKARIITGLSMVRGYKQAT